MTRKLAFPLFTKSEKFLILEISEEWLKLACVLIRGKSREIRHFAVESIKDSHETEISQKIQDFLNTYRFKPQQVLISHPIHQLTTRFLSVPSTDLNEIKDIIELQAVKQTPYSREEIVTDFILLGSEETGYSQVLLAISHRDVVSRYYRIAEMARVFAKRISISWEGVQNWYLQAQSSEVQSGEKTTLLLNLDSTTTDLLIFFGGKIVYGRSLSIGATQIVGQGPALQNKFIREVQLSIESGQGELKGRKMDEIVLTGVDDGIQDLVALISREWSLPCKSVAIFEKLDKRVHSEVRNAFPKASCSLVSVIGMALAPDLCKVNLIPPEVGIRRSLEERAKDLAVLGTTFLALMTLLSVIVFQKYFRGVAYLEKLEKDFQSIQAEAIHLERLVAKMELAGEQASAGRHFLDVLKDINEVLPDSIYLTSLQFNDPDRSVVIRGVSEEMSSVFQLLSTLEATSHLEFVKTRNVTKRKIDDQDLAEFEIVADIVGEHEKAVSSA